MNILSPVNQKKLFGLNKFFLQLIELYNKNNLPNKILLSGQKGLGKSTLAYHMINQILSKDEKLSYDLSKMEINEKSQTYKTICNGSNPNFFLIDINIDKKNISINQIRELISYLNKSTFNQKPRFVLIDNIEFMNINAINALLKVLEEPNSNVHFILINNKKKVLPTLLSRCVNFNIFLSHKESLGVANILLNEDLNKLVNNDLINYYLTPGNIYYLVKFAELYKYNLSNLKLNDFLKIVIKDDHYKNNNIISHLIYDFIEFYFRKISISFSFEVLNKYSYFLKRISDSKKFNLDEESLFIEFEEDILNG